MVSIVTASQAHFTQLGDGIIHIWWVDMSQFSVEELNPQRILTEQEIARAERFIFEKDTKQYLLSSFFLRQMLGSYLQLDPANIPFGRGEYGKPFVQGSDLGFNITHSGDYLLLGFSEQANVGVDVERYRDMRDLDGMVKSVFTELEQQHFFSLPDHEREPAFFRAWTAKEATIKAIGHGLYFPMTSVDVDYTSASRLALRALLEDNVDARDWILYSLPMSENYAAALTIDKAMHTIHLIKVSPELDFLL